jgi:hypothetical protein
MQLLHSQPSGPINAQIHHHLLAPKRPPFIKNGMREQTPPFSGVTVGGDELQMMARVSFMGTGQRNSEVLLPLR